MRRFPWPLAAAVVAGCAAHPSPATVPAPVARTAELAAPAAVSVATVVTPAPDTSRAVTLAGAPAAAVAAPAPRVASQAVALFGEPIAAAPPVVDSAADEPTWDMDVRSYETQERVAHYVSAFSGRNKARVADRLTKGTRYESMIRAKFREGGLPEDMYYLALIESGYDPNAYSRAAAVGMWQFMTSTGRDLGLRIDSWVDERRDPVRSTTAAVRFIRGLRDQFGSLYLAAAAYNGGPGRVARGLAKYSDEMENTQQPEDAFFVLAEKDYLRNETREYVPQLIAAALVAKEPVRYGMELQPLPPFAYDSVRAPASTPLAAIAKASGTTVAALRELNPQFLRGMTPPGERVQVRLPVGAGAGFADALEALPRGERAATRAVTSRKGETVDRIAEANGIPASAVESWNPHLRHLKPSGRLVAGQELVLPTPAVAAASAHVPDPEIEKYGSGKGAKLVTHTVRRGETVRSIARKYKTTPERLMRLNGLRKPVLFAGQDLIVSAPAGKRGTAAAKARLASARSGRGKSAVRRPAGATKAAKGGKAARSSSEKGSSKKKSTPKAAKTAGNAKKGAQSAHKAAKAKAGK